ncbi:prostatic acid phosphatase-like isoform X2 [Homalodisca vitripennis]|uniref:prostatic acid phosphatase-like isoform X2 n=1 Tax=Homalodisca vitripennis TaxID=197043 RepID=UPI001EEC0054|nr:prostatic acid phosphatase-like isoform X2 [Homalodisca vitripennis]
MGTVVGILFPALAFLILFSYSSSAPTTTTTESPVEEGPRAVPTLKLLVVFTRHGSRGPIYTFPTSPYQRDDLKYWPYGEAQLTNRGRARLYKLGKKVRSLYNGFLDELYQQEDIRANSTLYVRSMISAEHFLAGLYPPKGYQVWSDELQWQAIPLFPNYVDHHQLVYSKETRWCPRFHAAKRKSLLRFVKEYESNLTEIFDYVKPYTEIERMEPLDDSISKWAAMYTLWESMFCPDEEGLPLPEWTKKIYPHPMTEMADKLLRVGAIGSDTQIKYLQGEYFQEVANLMKAKVNGTLTPDRKMFYYAGHDYTLLGMQGILGLADEPTGHLNARTGSSLILELHKDQDTSQYSVKVVYIDGSSEDLEPIDVDIPGCGSPCDFHLLMSKAEKYYDIKNWQTECQIIED